MGKSDYADFEWGVEWNDKGLGGLALRSAQQGRHFRCACSIRGDDMMPPIAGCFAVKAEFLSLAEMKSGAGNRESCESGAFFSNCR